jgi:fatty-acid desaturase
LFITVIKQILALVSVVEGCHSIPVVSWEKKHYTNHAYINTHKGPNEKRERKMVGRFGREIMEDACMFCSKALFRMMKELAAAQKSPPINSVVGSLWL